MDIVSIPIAFLAGLISFLAPCVVPLLPAYIGYVSGITLADLKTQGVEKYRRRLLISSLLYALGFSLVFILLGFSATAVSKFLIINRTLLLQIGGLLIIFFGISLLGLFSKLSVANKEFRIVLPESIRNTRYLGAFIMGITFALAWSPCVGVILGAILTLAATSQNLGYSALLLFVYSMGIAIPFVLVALTFGSSIKLLSNILPFVHKLSVIGGILLILVGILMFTQKYAELSSFFLEILYGWEFYRNLQLSI